MFRTQNAGTKTEGARVRLSATMGCLENDPAVVDLVLEVELTGLLFGDNVIGRSSTRRTPVAIGILRREGSLHDRR